MSFSSPARGGADDASSTFTVGIQPDARKISRSPDADIVHYSWTYFEKGGPEVQREQLIRWAQVMPKRPMVHHLVARGKSNTCEGDNRANVELDRHYAPYGYNAFCIQTGLYAGGHDYDKEVEEGINRFGWQHQGKEGGLRERNRVSISESLN